MEETDLFIDVIFKKKNVKENFDMERTYKINVDCANCAAKMERAIEKIKGVESVSINFMSQKAFIEADEGDFDRIIEEAAKAVDKIDKGTVLEAL